MHGPLLITGAVDILSSSATLLKPGLMGERLSGDTKPWMVLETRAETVTRLWSGELLCGLAEVVEFSEDRELVAVS